MDKSKSRKVPDRKDHRIIIHFDYDCFYAAVFEAANPALKSLPFAVQQKQIIVTCNYEARRRGLYKLQLLTDAKRMCPDVIIELGEDISRFRDASKELYNFIKAFSWNCKVERLGFDEVWMDVTDMIGYNMQLLNRHSPEHSFFQLSRDDPTIGFLFDATCFAGHSYPKDYAPPTNDTDTLTVRLRLGSHLALYMRHQLEQQKGYTSTVGIATSKLLSKLVGNINKPKGQTTIMPPYTTGGEQASNVTMFIDSHDVGKIPGIGFKLAQKLRAHVLQRPADFDKGLVYGATMEKVATGDVRRTPDVDPEMLEKMLAGPGSPHGIGYKIWCLINGIDDTEVGHAKAIPSQISQEDSYIRLDTIAGLLKELAILSGSLITRMRIDLLGLDDDDDVGTPEIQTTKGAINGVVIGKRWLAHPKTLRLTTRPRQPLQPDGTRVRSFKRISHSAPLPNFVFSLTESVDFLAEKLVQEILVHMFRKLHPEKAGWNVSLVNIAVCNMAETAGESKTANGRNIGSMFKKQEDVLKDFRITNATPSPEPAKPRVAEVSSTHLTSSDKIPPGTDVHNLDELVEQDAWEDDSENGESPRCGYCGATIPLFAMVAHLRFHDMER